MEIVFKKTESMTQRESVILTPRFEPAWTQSHCWASPWPEEKGSHHSSPTGSQ